MSQRRAKERVERGYTEKGKERVERKGRKGRKGKKNTTLRNIIMYRTTSILGSIMARERERDSSFPFTQLLQCQQMLQL